MRKTLKRKANATRKRPHPASKLDIRQILVPLDFSGFARQALACAVPLARTNGAKISLVHVVHPPMAVGAIPMGGAYLPMRTDNIMSATNALQAAKTQLEKLAVQLLPADLRDRKMVRLGNAAYEVAAAAKALKADLIVLSTHGRSGLKRVLLGSTAERIVRHAHCPVLAVRRQPGGPALRLLAQEKPVYPERLPWRRILVPLDFSLASLRALQTAGRLASQCGAQLILLHAVEPSPYPTGMDGGILTMPDAEVVRKARAQLPRVARRLVPKAVRVTTLVSQGRAASVIVDAAAAKRIDLIMLATHGHTGLERLLMGSTTEEVVRHAKCPVWVVRKPQG